MLKSVEILIGLSVVMLVLSMVVTMLTQFVTSAVNTRGRHLKKGLADLLKQLDPQLTEIADDVAARMLTHPVIRESFGRMGSVIQREEFTKLLLELASGEGPHGWTDPAEIAKYRDRLLKVLEENGVSDPAGKLQNVRMLALTLEASNPQLANNVRQSIALLQEASSPLTAKINAWFDQMMDRTADRFTFTTRGITFVCAAIVALLLQVDTIGLVNRLSADDRLRADLGQLADKVVETQSTDRAIQELARDPQYAKLSDEAKRQRVLSRSSAASNLSNEALNDLIKRRAMREFVNDPAFTTATDEQQRAKLRAFRPDLAKSKDEDVDAIIREYSRPDLADSDKQYLSFLSEDGLVTLPEGGKWWAGFKQKNFFGMMVSTFLLSLGAPFWYSMLKQLINLRSVLAGKEDKQREERQTTQDTPAGQTNATPAGTPATLITGGERGDLGALG